MLGDVFGNAVERARPQGIVVRHRHVMLATFLRREPQVRTLLGDHLSERFQQRGQFRPRNGPR